MKDGSFVGLKSLFSFVFLLTQTFCSHDSCHTAREAFVSFLQLLRCCKKFFCDGILQREYFFYIRNNVCVVAMVTNETSGL